MMFSCLQTHVRSLVPFQRSKGGGGEATHRKCRRSLISRSVRRQNIECSNGVIRLIATFVDEGTCTAETLRNGRARNHR